MADEEFWKRLIKKPFKENNPFTQYKLSYSYLDVRQLLTEIYNTMDLSTLNFELSKENISDIVISLRQKSMGGLSDHLEDVLIGLSQEKYIKKDVEYQILTYNPPLPVHTYCNTKLVNNINDSIYRKCGNCGREIPFKVTWDKKILDDWTQNQKREVTCQNCNKTIPFNGLFCRYCNPNDDKMQRLGWINPRNDIKWTNPSITFNEDFFKTILKGMSFEQDIYFNFREKFPNIRLSTKIFTETMPYGVEVDLLVADEMIGKIKTEYQLWAIEAKNWAQKVGVKPVKDFFDAVSPITKNLIFYSKSGLTEEAHNFCSQNAIIEGYGTYVPEINFLES